MNPRRLRSPFASVALSLAFIGFAVAPPSAIAAPKGHKHHKHHHHKHHQHHKAMAPKRALPVTSLYQLRSSWTDQDGKKVIFSSLQGKLRIISMIYASCPHACPMTIADLKRIEKALPASLRDKVGFVLVTFDPKRDTTKRLKALAKKHSLAPKRWTLLRGADGDVLELAAVLGVKFKKVSKTDYAHSNLISIIDPSGVRKHKQIGLNQDPAATLAAIYKILGHKPPAKRKPPTRKST